MKIVLPTYLLVLVLLSLGCFKHHRLKIVLKGFNDNSEVIYEKPKAKFHFSRRDLIHYCTMKDFTVHNNFIYKQVIEYLKQDTDTYVIITDTLGTKLVPDSTANVMSKSDTLTRVRDHGSPFAFVTEALDWALLDFAKSGKLKVFDKTENHFANYIVLDKVEESWYGETNIHLPNDSIAFSQVRWIR